jgi:[CysO sulfur-carrier protein]-S-L-cysteine hydrolase
MIGPAGARARPHPLSRRPAFRDDGTVRSSRAVVAMATSRSEPLIIPAEVRDAMISHCVKGSALACCGILAGVAPRASAVYPLRNAAESAARYYSDVRDLFRAARDMHEKGLEVVAIYHFRPQTAAVPSPTDLKENTYGDVPRVIVSLGESPRVRVWRLARRYCEELAWRLQPRDAEAAEGDGCVEMRPELEREGAVHVPTSFLGSILLRLFARRDPPTRIRIGRLQDRPPLKPEPMWDPSLDRPGE